MSKFFFSVKLLKPIKISEWLRLHCMEVFHYVANELRDTPLFENSPDEESIDEGAIYNDFDSTPMALLDSNENESFQFSQVSNESVADIPDSTDLINVVEEAILATDTNNGFLYEYLVKTYLYYLDIVKWYFLCDCGSRINVYLFFFLLSGF